MLTLTHRTRKKWQTTSQSKHGFRMPCAFGPIAIERVNILATKYVRPLKRGTKHLISKGLNLAISNERQSSWSVYFAIRFGLRLSRHIMNASKNLVNLDHKQVNAVASRIELDLRTGYAFTRFLTNSLRPLGGPLQKLTISYGMPRAQPLKIVVRSSFLQDHANFQPWALL